MPTAAIERTVEPAPRLAPEASRQLWAESRRSEHRARFDTWIAELARIFVGVDASDIAAALKPTLEVLGLGLEADRVLFFAAGPVSTSSPTARTNLFDLQDLWSPAGDGEDETLDLSPIDLDRLPDRGQGLRSGEPQRLPLFEDAHAAVPRSESRAAARWAPVRATLSLPCLSSAGLLGFFVVEAGVSASRWTEAIVERAGLVARQFATMLENHRLARQLDAIRVRQGHDERLETLGRVASSVAHDFNNVLTAILGYADLLEMELAEDGEGQLELAEIRQAAGRASDLIEQVLSFGRVRDAGVQSVDLAERVGCYESMLTRVLGNGIVLELDLEAATDGGAKPAEVRIDPGRFERALLNLASNARAALAGNSGERRFGLALRRVMIDAEGRDASAAGSSPVAGVRPGDHMRLTAHDNGCGIDPALITRIFEPFFTTKETTGGTGLGLATTAEVLRECGGGVRVESAPSEGAAFHLYFPIVEA